MKVLAKALIVLTCFAAANAMASTQMTVIAKVRGFSNAQLCFLENASTEFGASLVRGELDRRNAECTPELASQGEASLVKTVSLREARAEKAWEHRNTLTEQQQMQKWIACSQGNGQPQGLCK